jgi:hypothetical protein
MWDPAGELMAGTDALAGAPNRKSSIELFAGMPSP